MLQFQRLLYTLQDEDTLYRLCHCLCKFASEVPEIERAESLGTCLEMLYNMFPDGKSKESTMILEVLGVAQHVKDLENDMNQLNV